MTKQELKKWVLNHQSEVCFGIALASAVGILIAAEKALRTTVDISVEALRPKEAVFEELRDLDISKAFAVVEYEDGDIGIIKDVLQVATRLAQQESTYYRYTNILIDNLPDDKVGVVTGAANLMKLAGLDVTIM